MTALIELSEIIMENMNKFGPTFKKLREKRGYSVKEACQDGAILREQSLRKFERGDSSTSVDTFNRLLLAIGADWDDFFILYEGNTIMELLTKQVAGLNHIQTTGQYHTLPKLINSLTVEIPENPNLSKLLALSSELTLSARKDNLVPINQNDPRFSIIFDHFDKVETWGVLEESLFYQCLRIFEPEFVDFHIHKFLDDFETNPPKMKDDWASRFIIADYTVSYFSKHQAFPYADKLICRLETMFTSDKYIGFWNEKFSLAMFKASHLLRQGKPEGLELAKTIVKTYQLFADNFYSPYAIAHLNAYIDVVHTLNKTGIPFDPY